MNEQSQKIILASSNPGKLREIKAIFEDQPYTLTPQAEFNVSDADETGLTFVENAIIHGVSSIENGVIDIRAKMAGNDLHIEVEDNGKGIEEDVKHLIFEPKFTTKSSGMGLGLPMIKNIIEAYQGSISFVSAEGVGTTFKVRLPKS